MSAWYFCSSIVEGFDIVEFSKILLTLGVIGGLVLTESTLTFSETSAGGKPALPLTSKAGELVKIADNALQEVSGSCGIEGWHLEREVSSDKSAKRSWRSRYFLLSFLY